MRLEKVIQGDIDFLDLEVTPFNNYYLCAYINDTRTRIAEIYVCNIAKKLKLKAVVYNTDLEDDEDLDDEE